MTRTIFLFALLFLVGGCGQSGPLYLPGDPSEIREAPQPTDSEEEEEDSGNSG